MSDLIRRQDVIDAFELRLENDYVDATELLAFVKQLPSVEPEQKWIPCNARMPEEREWLGTKQFGTTKSDEVYVTFENPKGERFCKHLSFQNGKLSRFDQSTIDAFCPEAKPIAWMPLPKPWRFEE